MTDTSRVKGTTHAILHDVWDKDALKRGGKAVRALARARRKVNEHALTGTDAVDDAFFVLHKADPHLVDRARMRPSHLVNRTVVTELMGLPSVRRLREHTVGDLVAAAAGAADLAPALEVIFDRLQVATDLADKLQLTLAALERAREAAQEAQDAVLVLSEEIGSPGMDEALERLRNCNGTVVLFEGVAEDQEHALNEELAHSGGEVAYLLSDALSGIVDRQAEQDGVARAWGVDPGQLTRMPAAERLQLARRLNNPRLVQIASLFGRIDNLALSSAAEHVEDVHDDVVDLESGGDLDRLVPSEFLLLGHPVTELDFLARLAEEELAQYAVRGTDFAGRGGIVMCIDGSGSMRFGDREIWAKAVMLALMNQARIQRRTMHVVHFGYRKVVHFPFVGPADWTPERVIAAAEVFWGAGTDFETPMAKVTEILREEFAATGHTTADVVFATDDECYVRPEFMADYLAQMREMGARTWGLAVGCDPAPAGPLWQMSEGRVFSVEDVASGDDLRPVLAGLR